MKLLKKRSFAILIVVVVVIASTLVGVYSSANRVTREIEAHFFDGFILEDGRPQASIYRHLSNAADAALSLATLMRNYPELEDKADALITAQRDFLAAEDIFGKQLSTFAMQFAFSDLEDAALQADLTERDKDALRQLSSTFNGAITAISNSQYNAFLVERLSEQNILLREIGRLLGVREPLTFRLS